MRVLIVDDNHDTAYALSRLMCYAGHATRTAENGFVALDIAADFLPDAVLLDIRLPGMDGYEVARRLRHLECDTFRMRIIAISGIAGELDRDRCGAIDHHLVKPVSVNDILDVMGQHRLEFPMGSTRRPWE